VNAPARIALVLAAAVIAVALFLVLREGDEEPREAAATAVADTTAAEAGDTTETTQTATTEEGPDVVRVRIQVGPKGPSGVRRIEVEEGQDVVLTVRSQVADHIHVHGYDLLADVRPGRPARFEFRATLPGRFEIELEDRGEQIAQLRVSP
jgi:FtsP/CotA-like multicopper oxidase with cupredoxin domain